MNNKSKWAKKMGNLGFRNCLRLWGREVGRLFTERTHLSNRCPVDPIVNIFIKKVMKTKHPILFSIVKLSQHWVKKQQKEKHADFRRFYFPEKEIKEQLQIIRDFIYILFVDWILEWAAFRILNSLEFFPLAFANFLTLKILLSEILLFFQNFTFGNLNFFRSSWVYLSVSFFDTEEWVESGETSTRRIKGRKSNINRMTKKNLKNFFCSFNFFFFAKIQIWFLA